MMNEQRVREAFSVFQEGAMRAKEGSEVWATCCAAAGVLGWVLEEGNYLKNTQVIIDHIKSLGRVSG